MKNDYLALIPARGGSKRISRKNLSLFKGKPLIAHTIEAALESSCLNRVIVSTEDPEIAEVAKQYHAEVPFMRPVELAQDQSPMVEVINHALDNVLNDTNVDAIVLLQPTSPFRTGRHIDEAIGVFQQYAADTVTSVCIAERHPYYAWTLSGEVLVPFFSTKHQTMARQKLPVAFFENGAIYVIKKDVLTFGTIYGQKIIPYFMDPRDSVDIDTQKDLLWAEFLEKYDRSSPEIYHET